MGVIKPGVWINLLLPGCIFVPLFYIHNGTEIGKAAYFFWAVYAVYLGLVALCVGCFPRRVDPWIKRQDILSSLSSRARVGKEESTHSA